MLLKVGSKRIKNYPVVLMRELQSIVPEIIEVNEYPLFVVSGSSIIPNDESKLLNASLEVQSEKKSIDNNEIVILPRQGMHSDLGFKLTQWANDCRFHSIQHIELGKLYYLNIDRHEPLNLMESSHLSRILGDMTNEIAFTHYYRLKYVYEGVVMPRIKWFNLGKGSWLINKFLANYNYKGLANNLLEDLLEVVSSRRSVSELELAMLAWYLKSQKENCIKNNFESIFFLNKKKYLEADVSKFSLIGMPIMNHATNYYNRENSESEWIMSRGTYSENFIYSTYFAGMQSSRALSEQIVSSYLGVRQSYVNISFFTNNYCVPGYERLWEKSATNNEPGYKKAINVISALSSYFSQVGVPVIGGSSRIMDDVLLNVGFDTPILSLGGGGKRLLSAENNHVVDVGYKLVLVGSMAMARIPLEHLEDAFPDNKSCYRGLLLSTNPELQRRCQALLNRCAECKENNPVSDIIKTQGKGLSTAIMNYLKGKKMGAVIQLRSIPAVHPGINLCELLTHEIGDRYLLVINPSLYNNFKHIAERESCNYDVIGELNDDGCLVIEDEKANRPVAQFEVKDYEDAGSYSIEPYKKVVSLPKDKPFKWSLGDDFTKVVGEVLQHPNTGDKGFFIHRVDSSIGGLVAQDALVGSNQVAVSDCQVMLSDFDGYRGVGISLGECPLLATIDERVGTLMAINEAITNLLGIPWKDGHCEISVSLLIRGDKINSKSSKEVLRQIKAYTKELSIDVLNLDCQLSKQKTIVDAEVPAIVVEARAEMINVNDRVDPTMDASKGSTLYWVNLNNTAGLAGSTFTAVNNRTGVKLPGVPTVDEMKSLIKVMQILHADKNCAAYHDVSSGGVMVTLIEMFLSSVGVESFDCVDVKWPEGLSKDYLFSEGTGVVVQVSDDEAAEKAFETCNLTDKVIKIASIYSKNHYMDDSLFGITIEGRKYAWEMRELFYKWNTPTYLLQKCQDGDVISQEAKMNLVKLPSQGLSLQVKQYKLFTRRPLKADAPKAIILRERGGVGFFELAEAFIHAGFVAVDVDMNDLMTGKVNLNEYSILAVSGGSSYGDALSPGAMWAKKIIKLPELRQQFVKFFERKDTLVFGVGNGAQMLMVVHQELVSDTLWPKCLPNRSGHFESRLACVRIEEGNSPWLNGMHEQIIALPVACRYGSLKYDRRADVRGLNLDNAAMRFVNNEGSYASSYPHNPTGSDYQIASILSNNGRVLLSIGHPERAFLTRQFSWAPSEWQEYSPWFALFNNAYDFVMTHPQPPPGY